MDDRRVKYRIPGRGLDIDIGSNSAVLTQTFVADSLQRNERGDDGLNVFRGAVNALLISLVFWVALGVVLFGIF